MSRKSKPVSDGPRVYSYIRFSTPEQLEGDSLRRQVAAAEIWCKSKGLVLDYDLRMRDLGVSGYLGKNAAVGTLAGFLKAVEEGRVAKGSYLIVENFDRLSRDEVMKALYRFLDLVRAGIVVVTLEPAREYGKESDIADLFSAILEMSRAHGESLRKSKLRGARWKADRERMRTEKVALTRSAPEWLKKEGDVFKLIPERARVIREIFKLRREGLGPSRICKILNESAVWKPESRRRGAVNSPAGWRESYVKKILVSRSVIGEFQPHEIVYDEDDRKKRRVPSGDPIRGYYPPVIEEGAFLAVQSKTKSKALVGRTGKATNVLRSLSVCGYCGGPMHLVDKGKPPKGGVYLQCDRGRRGLGCSSVLMSYEKVRDAVLMNCWKLDPAKILPNVDETRSLVAELELSIDECEAKVEDCVRRLDIIEERILSSDDSRVHERYAKKQIAVLDEKEEVEGLLAAKRDELRKANRTKAETASALSEVGRLMKLIDGDDAVDTRLRLNEVLRGLLDAIECYPSGYSEEEEDEVAEYVGSVIIDSGAKVDRKLEAELIGFLEAKRRTREGAFVRLRFPTVGGPTGSPQAKPRPHRDSAFPSPLRWPLAIGPYASGYAIREIEGKKVSSPREPDLDAALAALRKSKKPLREKEKE